MLLLIATKVRLPMQMRIPSTDNPLVHPIHMMECVTKLNDWPLHYQSNNEISVEISGHWTNYFVTFRWQEKHSALHITVFCDIFVLEQQRRDAMAVICQLNRQTWLGHFDLINEEGSIMFRYTMPLRGAEGITPEQIQDLLETTIAECEKNYPALYHIALGTASTETAVATALIEPLGHA